MILSEKHHFTQCIKYEDSGQYIANYKGMTLRSVFQPIFSRNQDIVGVEALVRIYTSAQRQIRPDLFFHTDHFSHIDQLNVELLSRAIHIRNFAASSYKNIRLFLNVLPEASHYFLQNEKLSLQLTQRLAQLNITHPQIVMEVLEIESNDEPCLQKATKKLSSYGFHIAVDDYGSNASTSERVDLISPDIIKFDRSLLTRYMDGDTMPLVNGIQVAHSANAKTVVEGIETEEQFEAMKRLNLNMYQGYFLGLPEEIVSNIQVACG